MVYTSSGQAGLVIMVVELYVVILTVTKYNSFKDIGQYFNN